MANQVTTREALARKIAEAVRNEGFHYDCWNSDREGDLTHLSALISPLLPDGDGWKERARKAETELSALRGEQAKIRSGMIEIASDAASGKYYPQLTGCRTIRHAQAAIKNQDSMRLKLTEKLRILIDKMRPAPPAEGQPAAKEGR